MKHFRFWRLSDQTITRGSTFHPAMRFQLPPSLVDIGVTDHHFMWSMYGTILFGNQAFTAQSLEGYMLKVNKYWPRFSYSIIFKWKLQWIKTLRNWSLYREMMHVYGQSTGCYRYNFSYDNLCKSMSYVFDMIYVYGCASRCVNVHAYIYDINHNTTHHYQGELWWTFW